MFADKTILVTGATSGIGRAVCRDLLDAGASLIAVGRNEEELAALAARAPDQVRTLAFDLTDFGRYAELIPPLGAVDGVVCSAGIADRFPLRFFSLERYQRVIDINQTAPIALISQLARGGQLKTSASVVFLSSILGTQVGSKGSLAYAASKAALVAFAKVLALELAPRKIRVNTLSPGMVHTALNANQEQVSAEALKLDIERYPLKRYAEAPEIASAVRFLLSDGSAFMTGSDIVMDGGFSIQ